MDDTPHIGGADLRTDEHSRSTEEGHSRHWSASSPPPITGANRSWRLCARWSRNHFPPPVRGRRHRRRLHGWLRRRLPRAADVLHLACDRTGERRPSRGPQRWLPAGARATTGLPRRRRHSRSRLSHRALAHPSTGVETGGDRPAAPATQRAPPTMGLLGTGDAGAAVRCHGAWRVGAVAAPVLHRQRFSRARGCA